MPRPLLRILGCVAGSACLTLLLVLTLLTLARAQTASSAPQQRTSPAFSLRATNVSTSTAWLPLVTRPGIDDNAGALQVTIQPDTDRAVSKSIPPAGGTVVATSADGDRFTLTLPAGALLVTTTVTLTPVRTIADSPYATVAAVQIGPDLLSLHHAATLLILPAPAVAVDQEVTFAWFGRGQDFHRYPVSLDITKLEFALVRLHGYGVGRTAAASTADAASIDAPAWTPSDELAQLMQQMRDLVNRERERQYLGEPADLEFATKAVALLREFYTLKLKPNLPAMEDDCIVYEAQVPLLLGWQTNVEMLDAGADFSTEREEIAAAWRKGLANCYREVAAPCIDPSDLIQETLVNSYYRELILSGWQEDVPSPQELPVCVAVDVTLSGGIFDHTLLPDPENGWVRAYRYRFPDDTVSGGGFFFPPGLSHPYVTARMRVDDTWVELPAFPTNNFYCRDRADERMSEFIVTILLTETTTFAANPRMIADNIGCWRWQGTYSMHQTWDEYYGAAGYTRNTDVASENVLFEREAAARNREWHQFNPTTGALEVAGAVYYPVPSQGRLNFTYHWHAIDSEGRTWRQVDSKATNVLVNEPFDAGSYITVPNVVPADSYLYRYLTGQSVMMDVPMEETIQHSGAGSCLPHPRRVTYYAFARPQLDLSGKSSSGETIQDGRADVIKDYTVTRWTFTALREQP